MALPRLPYPTLDGFAPSWADISVTLVPFAGPLQGVADAASAALFEMSEIAAVNSGATVEVGSQRGPGGRVRKRTTGSVDYESSVTFYRSGFQGFLRRIKDVAPLEGNQRRVSLVTFNLNFVHSAPGDPNLYEVRLKGCRYLGRTLNTAEGTDPDQVEVPLSVLQVVDVIDGEEVVPL